MQLIVSLSGDLRASKTKKIAKRTIMGQSLVIVAAENVQDSGRLAGIFAVQAGVPIIPFPILAYLYRSTYKGNPIWECRIQGETLHLLRWDEKDSLTKSMVIQIPNCVLLIEKANLELLLEACRQRDIDTEVHIYNGMLHTS